MLATCANCGYEALGLALNEPQLCIRCRPPAPPTAVCSHCQAPVRPTPSMLCDPCYQAFHAPYQSAAAPISDILDNPAP